MTLVPAYFNASLPPFLETHLEPCSFIHIDCDLYSSTTDIFQALLSAKRIVADTVILFDEFYNYQYFANDEFKAFAEVFSKNALACKWLAHAESAVDWNGNQAALLIL